MSTYPVRFSTVAFIWLFPLFPTSTDPVGDNGKNVSHCHPVGTKGKSILLLCPTKIKSMYVNENTAVIIHVTKNILKIMTCSIRPDISITLVEVDFIPTISTDSDEWKFISTYRFLSGGCSVDIYVYDFE